MVYGFDNFGYEGRLYKVSVDVTEGEGFFINKLTEDDTKETRECCKTALKEDFDISSKKVLVNLMPLDIYRNSEFPITLAILATKWKEDNKKVLVVGQLAFEDEITSTDGTYGACLNAIKEGIEYAILPEGSVVPGGIKVCFVKNIYEAYNAYYALQNGSDCWFYKINTNQAVSDNIKFQDASDTTFNLDKLPQSMTLQLLNDFKFAMTVAVAGKHNMLITGNGGLVNEFTNILPKLNYEEQEEVNRIYSSKGLLPVSRIVRPFRAPRPSTTIQSMFGGDNKQTAPAGEISLAHNGVLFLEQANEFRTSVLQMLRVPATNGNIILTGKTFWGYKETVYPSNFQLIMSVKPCPCGNYGVKDKVCLCSKEELEQYWKKFSQPLLDMIDVRFNCYSNDCLTDQKMNIETMRQLITNAWKTQQKRGEFNGRKMNGFSMSELSVAFESDNDLSDFLLLLSSHESKEVEPIVKVARTIADMYGRKKITHSDYLTAKKLRTETVLKQFQNQ